MRKLAVMTVLGFALIFMLGACGGNSTNGNDAQDAPLQDGTYSLFETSFDENGWKVVMEITVEDGNIISSDFNYENENGELKTEDDEYQDLMKDIAGVGPKEFIPELNESLVTTQDPNQVEVVSGATSSSETFIDYAKQLIEAAQNGDTTPIEIN